MKKSNIFSPGDKRNVSPDWFTGKVWMKDISDKIKSKEQKIFHVNFEKGARTKLHEHNGSQILIATKGNGSLVMYKKLGRKTENFRIKKIESIPLREGDVVYIPANKLHTHGSIDQKRSFSHIAINIFPRKNSEYITRWYESDFKTKVTKKI